MPVFRVYVLDLEGKITSGDWIEAADQGEAEAKAHKMCDEGHPMVELWSGTSRLAEIDCHEGERAA